MKIPEIEIPLQLINTSCYLNKNNLEQYKQKKNNETCIKCNRVPKYINNDSNELFCWNHCI